MVVKYLFLFLFFCFMFLFNSRLFLSFLRSGIRDVTASENGHKIVSRGEQSCSVKKTNWCCVECSICLCLVLPHAFYFGRWECLCKCQVAVALFTTSVLCTYPVLWQLYIFESEERKYPSKIYIFCSPILFSLIVAWQNKSLWEQKEEVVHLITCIT